MDYRSPRRPLIFGNFKKIFILKLHFGKSLPTLKSSPRYLFALMLISFCWPAMASLAGLFGMGGSDGQITKIQFRLQENHSVTSLAWSPDGKYIVTGSLESGDVHVWSVAQRKIIKEFNFPAGAPGFHVISFSPDNKYLAFCTWNGSTAVYQVGVWTPVANMNPQKNDANCSQAAPEFSSDSEEMATLGANYLAIRSTKDWSVKKNLYFFKSHGWRWITGSTLAYIPNAHDLLIGGAKLKPMEKPGYAQSNGYLFLLKAEDLMPSNEFKAYGESNFETSLDVIRIAISSTGKYIATGARTGDGAGKGPMLESVHFFNWPDMNLVAKPLDGQDFGPQHGLSYSKNGRYLIVGHNSNEDDSIHLIDASSFKVVDIAHGNGPIYDIAVGSDGESFASASGRTVIIWKILN